MQTSEENPKISISINSHENQVEVPNHYHENVNDRYCGLDVDSHFLIFVTIYIFIVITLYFTS